MDRRRFISLGLAASTSCFINAQAQNTVFDCTPVSTENTCNFDYSNTRSFKLNGWMSQFVKRQFGIPNFVDFNLIKNAELLLDDNSDPIVAKAKGDIPIIIAAPHAGHPNRSAAGSKTLGKRDHECTLDKSCLLYTSPSPRDS